jgi:hypothetical protein
MNLWINKQTWINDLNCSFQYDHQLNKQKQQFEYENKSLYIRVELKQEINSKKLKFLSKIYSFSLKNTFC